jgi:hypothetical protein
MEEMHPCTWQTIGDKQRRCTFLEGATKSIYLYPHYQLPPFGGAWLR